MSILNFYNISRLTKVTALFFASIALVVFFIFIDLTASGIPQCESIITKKAKDRCKLSHLISGENFTPDDCKIIKSGVLREKCFEKMKAKSEAMPEAKKLDDIFSEPASDNESLSDCDKLNDADLVKRCKLRIIAKDIKSGTKKPGCEAFTDFQDRSHCERFVMVEKKKIEAEKKYRESAEVEIDCTQSADKRGCFTFRALKYNDLSFCNRLRGDDKIMCMQEVIAADAIKKHDYSLCLKENMTKAFVENCQIRAVVAAKREKGIKCESLEGILRNVCMKYDISSNSR